MLGPVAVGVAIPDDTQIRADLLMADTHRSPKVGPWKIHAVSSLKIRKKVPPKGKATELLLLVDVTGLVTLENGAGAEAVECKVKGLRMEYELRDTSFVFKSALGDPQCPQGKPALPR
jgi:hypothetical protein